MKGKGTSADQRLERLKSVKDALFGEEVTLQVMDAVQEVIWKGVTVPVETGELCLEDIETEVLWELYEIGFRCDLVVVDRELAPSKWSTGRDSDAIDRLSQVHACFDGDNFEFIFLPPKIPERNVGLASDKVHDANPFIMALAHIIVNWDIPLDPLIGQCLQVSKKLSDVKTYHLFRALADAHCAGVYRVLGRAAVTPHRMKPVQK